MHTHPGRLRLIVGAAVLALGAGSVLAIATQASAAAGCRVNYQVNQWPGGFTAAIAVTNLGDPLRGWRLEFDYPDPNQRVGNGWIGGVVQNGQHVVITSQPWNAYLATNATVTPGVQGTYVGVNPSPTAFTLNGVTCGPGPTPTATSTRSPSRSPTPSMVPASSAPATTGPRESHVDNPYLGVAGYVNPQWKAQADAEPGGGRVSGNPTGIWLDRKAKIGGVAGLMGLRAHLSAALAQHAGYVQVVLNDLPGRDCHDLVLDGDFGVDELARYETEFIDPIAAIEADPAFGALRIVNVVEVDALPELVTSSPPQRCAQAAANGAYTDGIRYALNKLHPYSNIYNYLSVGYHGWLGWDANFGPAADLFTATVKGTTAGLASVDGFITNTASYAVVSEPLFTIATMVGGVSVRQSRWVDWNRYLDESAFARDLRDRLVASGFDPGIGMLIDTSRNGWGGPGRPTVASTSIDVNTFVDGSRVDRRIHAGNWCNQAGAGLGVRPVAAPEPGIDAYVWMKPPGESDGSSTDIANELNYPYDRMCDPTYAGDQRNGNNPSGALPGAPARGAWFSAEFRELMATAYPPLP
jgi:cellulose 1,4-beta-cellobiosidase